MWNCCQQVLKTYLTRKVFWFFAALYATSIPMTISAASGNKEVAKALPVMLQGFFFGAYLCFGLGVHLKQQFANPRAKTMPGFATPHLIVGIGGVVVLSVLSSLMSALSSGSSPMGFLALILHVNSLALWLGCNPKPLPFSAFLCTVFGFPISAFGRALFVEIAMTREPILVVTIIAMHLFGLMLLTLDLIDLDEDHLDYSKVQPLGMWDMRASTQRNMQRNFSASHGWMAKALSWASTGALNRASAQPAMTTRQRLALIALGDNWPAPIAVNLLVLALICVSPLIWLGRQRVVASDEIQQFIRFIFPMMMCFVWGVWLTWLQRWPRLGYESLRPVSRSEWVWENGLSNARSMAQHHVFAVVIQVLIALAFTSDVAGDPRFWVSLWWATAAQVLAFGIMAWAASYGSMLVAGLATAPVTMVLAIPMAILQKDGFQIQHMVWASLMLVLLGIGLTRVAYSKWCRMDLP